MVPTDDQPSAHNLNADLNTEQRWCVRNDMRIAEIIGAVADQEHEPAPVSGLMQHVANAFTATGRVKRPLGFQGSEEPATATAALYSYLPASEEGTSTVQSTDVLQNAVTAVSPLSDPRRKFQSPLAAQHVNPFTP
jgi:hypothetical protein